MPTLKENKIKTILVSQPKPESDKSPYFDLAKRCKLKIDFRPFIHVEGLTAKEFRLQKISILSHDAVIFTSKNSMDHFFRMCEATRITVPEEMKYFILHIIALLFETKYLFEEISYHSFLFEKVGGIFLFPLVLLSIYSPFSPKIMFQIALSFFFLIFVFKCIRIIYLSFFKTSFSKTHIIVYLCTLEILPLLLFINKIS